MPHVRRARLRWVETVTLTPTSTMDIVAFSANNAREPNASTPTHQPMAWDQWAALYNKFVVVGAKMNVRILPTRYSQEVSASVYRATAFGVYVGSGNTPTYTTANSYIEAKKGSYRLSSGAITRTVSMNSMFSTKKFFNVKDVKDVTSLVTSVTGSPTEEAFFVLWSQITDASGATSVDVPVTVTIDYIIDFSDPKDMTPS